VVDEGAKIGAGTKIWHFCHLFSGATIGRNCIIGQGCSVAARAVLGDGVKLQNGVSVYDGVILEEGVFCGPHMVFTNVLNPRAFIDRKHEIRPTRVGRGATIGAGAVIVCGCTIGEYAMVGAGAVVTRDVPPFALVYGNPARQRGWVDRDGNRLPHVANGMVLGHDSERHAMHDLAVRLKVA
jgi:UDP-2-acetamido-3-amino-2,3-dideoxy-glucuronate N-acetyltransferase